MNVPNVEIHGMSDWIAARLESKIFKLFGDKPYIEEMVVTIYRTIVRDFKGNSQPFIRLVNSCQEHSEEIVENLKTLGIDVEHLKLESFIPKEKKNSRSCEFFQ